MTKDGVAVPLGAQSEKGNCFGNRRLNYGANARRLPCTFTRTGTKTAPDISIWSNWSVDLVAVTAAGILAVGFVCAVVTLLVH